MRTKSRILILGIFVALFSLSQMNLTAQELNSKLSSIFDKYTQQEGIHNAFLQIKTATGEELINKTFGQFSDGTTVKLGTPFYTASIGKTFTATAIALLKEEGKIRFNDAIENYLPADLMNGLHVYNGKDYTRSITISQLLSHTSGLPDLFEDRPTIGLNMMEMLLTEPNKFWQPRDLLTFSKDGFEAKFKPGTSFHYSDTGYILLGLLVEEVSGKQLHEFIENQIIQPLRLKSTFFNLRSDRQFSMAEMYLGPSEISGLKSLSADWAGGGIVSTPESLNRFLSALLSGRVLKKETLSQMQQWTPFSSGTYYGFGLRKWVLNELSPTLPQLTLIGHSGSNSSYMFYCPELEVYLSGTFNQTGFKKASILFIAEVLSLIQNS